MNRAILAALVALILWPSAASAHDVPDDVRINVFFHPEGDRMVILVRIPANALIDILFPMRPESDWLDLKPIDGYAMEGAKVWVADLLSIYEGDTLLLTPQVREVRISRSSNPSFNTFQGALDHLKGERLPPDTLLTMDQAVVDARLETSIRSMSSDFSFEPRFARVGVRVTTTLAFLPPAGGIRKFEYEGDVETFKLNPSWTEAVSHFIPEGLAHLFAVTDYLLFVLCVALLFQYVRTVVPFAAAFAAATSLAMVCSGIGLMPSAEWIRPLWGVLIAAAVVYMGMEAIVADAPDDGKPVLAVVTGLVFGCGFWFGLEPVIQFGGTHRLASILAFNIGILIGYISVLTLLVIILKFLFRSSGAPRVAVIILAAIAIRISWHQVLDRARALSLLPMNFPALNPAALTLAAMSVAALLTATALFFRSQRLSSTAR